MFSLVLPACGSEPEPGPFSSIGFTVTPAGQTTTAGRWCAYLADTPSLREKGLMKTTNLKGREGMLFRFESDTTARFHMLDTPLPLSIAWFDSGGAYVGQADMEPCLSGDCPLYGPDEAYRTALEVPKGQLPSLKVGPGSVLRVGGSCGD